MLNIIKTKSFKITAALLALALIVSCVLWNTTRVHAQELSLGNTNVQTFAGARAITNGKLEGTQENPATMSVFVTGGSHDRYNAINMEWKHSGEGWQSSGASVFFMGVNSNQKIYACAPYAKDADDGTITVNAADQTDWLVATATDLVSGDVDLEMTHALSKLVLVPTFGTEVTEGNRNIAKVEVGGMYASGSLKISDNTWSNTGDANAILEMKNNELLVIPMEKCTSFPVVITLEDGSKYTTEISLENVNDQLAAGTQYNISLQVGQDKVTLGNITAEGWGTPIDGGVLETE